jgi:hypothetical protein
MLLKQRTRILFGINALSDVDLLAPAAEAAAVKVEAIGCML